jgi:hypothetical protein
MFQAETMKIKDFFALMSRVLGHDISVQYLSKESSYEYEEEQKKAGNMLMWSLASLRRAIGFGGSYLPHTVNAEYPEIKPITFEQTLRETWV